MFWNPIPRISNTRKSLVCISMFAKPRIEIAKIVNFGDSKSCDQGSRNMEILLLEKQLARSHPLGMPRFDGLFKLHQALKSILSRAFGT